MYIQNQCIPCMTKALVKLAEKVSSTKEVQRDIIEHGLTLLSKSPYGRTSPEVTADIYRFAKEASGNTDPYKEEKDKYNRIAEKLIDELCLEERVRTSDFPLETAVRLSIAGNIIDYSLGHDVDQSSVVDSINESLKTDLFGMNIRAFEQAVADANRIMILSDNAGEIVFDRLLVDQLPKEKIIYVVKKGAIVNDANMEDAITSGMIQRVKVIDNGTSIQGTVLTACSDQFKNEFHKSDLIISKGQANFETLEAIKDKTIYYLFRAKCEVIANQAGCEHGDFVFMKN